MNPYVLISSKLGITNAQSLVQRLAQWHDAMVAHERRLGAGRADACSDDCAHAEARELWAEALATFGRDAQELAFLRTRATTTRKVA
jgi:hypothetical protein